MDQYRQQQEPAWSVNQFAPATAFSQYLRAAFINETIPIYQHHLQYRPRQPRGPSTQQYIPLQHHLRPVHQPFSTMNPALNNGNQAFSPGLSQADAKAFLTSNCDDGIFDSSQGGGFAPVYHHVSHNQFTFRSLHPGPTENFEYPPAQPHKVDNEQVTGIMQLQTSHVDASQYSPISATEVWNTPYDVSSPSSVDTADDCPATPGFHKNDAFFTRYDAKYGPIDAHFFSSNHHAAHSMNAANGSFGSCTSNGSASFPGNGFVAQNPLSGGYTSSLQPLGLGINHQTTPDRHHTIGFAGPVFDTQAIDDEEDFGESAIEDDVTSEASVSSSAGISVRNERDQILLDMRNKGYSYKEIKRMHNFKEAESTLRGRMRVLTKQKHERVRRPVWQASDIDLLHRAVKKGLGALPAGSRKRPGAKMPWLKISKWMCENGASYAFAPATCAKKWQELGGR